MSTTYLTYLVVGFYPDTNQRFAQDYQASTPARAEKEAVREHEVLVVAAVLQIHPDDLSVHERGDYARMRLIQ